MIGDMVKRYWLQLLVVALIGVLVGIIIAVLTYLTNLYFKIREDNRRSRSRDEPNVEE